jgi:diguanylate cyclase (GGDEF)-like protein
MSIPLRALIIEDSSDDLELLCHYLGESGYDLAVERVDTAKTLRAALMRPGWDVVLSDHAMPNFDIPAALAILKAHDLDLPFIIVSGAIGEEAAVALMKAGAHDYVLKDNLARLAPAIERERREAAARKAHRQAQAEILRLNAELEGRVRERTEQLIAANRELNARVSELERRDQESRSIREMGDLLQACRTTHEAHDVVARFIPPLFQTLSGAVYLADSTQHLLEAVAAWGEAGPELGLSTFTVEECWALRRSRLHVVEDVNAGPLCQHVEGRLPYLCAPVAAQGEALGVLHLRGPRTAADVAPLLQEGERLAAMLAEHIALALSNLDLRETLRNQAIRDPLTNLFNRRYMEESLERELRRVRRKGAPLGVIMLDVDHFKRFNDTFGHDGGDVLLRQLGSFLQASVRGEDIACRYGGEEFILIMPEASLAVAHQRAEHIRQQAKQLRLEHLGQPLGSITLSLGVAVFPDHGVASEVLIRAADAALYRAKHEGRDKVVIGS